MRKPIKTLAGCATLVQDIKSELDGLPVSDALTQIENKGDETAREDAQKLRTLFNDRIFIEVGFKAQRLKKAASFKNRTLPAAEREQYKNSLLLDIEDQKNPIDQLSSCLNLTEMFDACRDIRDFLTRHTSDTERKGNIKKVRDGLQAVLLRSPEQDAYNEVILAEIDRLEAIRDRKNKRQI